MESLKKFTFGESFINESGEVIIPGLEKARKEGVKEGYEQAKKDIEGEVAALMGVLNMRLEEVANRQKKAYEFVTESTLLLTKSVLKKIIPYAFDKYGEKEVELFVHDVLKGLTLKGAVTIYVHQNLLAPIQELISQNTTHLNENMHIQVKSESALDNRDCRIEWDDGGVGSIKSKLLLDVDKSFERVLANAPHEAVVEKTIEEEQIQEKPSEGENDV